MAPDPTDSRAHEHEGDGFEVSLAEIDSDGAIGEAVASVYGDTRAAFLTKAAFGGAAFLAALAAPEPAAARRVGDGDLLNFDLVFEYLQSNFYTEADRIGTVRRMPNALQLWARTLGAHERAHVAILKSVLGRDAVKSPFFNFRGITESRDKFVRTAVAMEDVTVALLLGQAPRFENKKLTAAVFSLLTVEARHAAWARRLAGFTPVRAARDRPRTIAQVDRIVKRTHFIARSPNLTSRSRPRYTG